jgi:hypothetical protein
MLTEAVSSIRALEEEVKNSVSAPERPQFEKRIAELKARYHYELFDLQQHAEILSQTL